MTDPRVETLRELMDDRWFGLVSVRPDTEGTLLYEDGTTVPNIRGEPTIEIPHEDPYLVDERGVPGGTVPATTFDGLLAQYGCTTVQHRSNTYVIVADGDNP